MTTEFPAGLDPVIRRQLVRGAQLAGETPEGAWPDRARASRLAARVFAEFGAMPRGRVAVADRRWDLPGRILTAREYRAGTEQRGVVVIVHGGGYAFGSLDDMVNEAVARSRAIGTRAVVIEVGYRLAPEHPFPAAVDDIRDAVLRIRDDVPESAGGLVLDGISSGGGIAAAAALELAAAGAPPLSGLVLEVPSVDLRPGAPWLSEYAAVGGLLPRERVREFYLAGADPDDPRASPAAGDLRLLPPTHVVTAEFDPLREVGERFADAIAAADVSVTAVRHASAAHNSFELVAGSPGSRHWHAGVEAAIRDLLSRSARTGHAVASSIAAPTT